MTVATALLKGASDLEFTVGKTTERDGEHPLNSRLLIYMKEHCNAQSMSHPSGTAQTKGRAVLVQRWGSAMTQLMTKRMSHAMTNAVLTNAVQSDDSSQPTRCWW